jgi:hypothetical protein
MNLSQLRTAFLDAISDPYGDEYPPERANRIINLSMEQIGKIIDAADEHFLAASTDFNVIAQTSDQEFELPQDFRKVMIFERLVTGERPVPLEWVDFTKRDLPTAGVGRDRYYLRTHDKIGIVSPLESYTARLHYSKLMAQMDDDQDRPNGIPNEHHYVIALHAAKLSYAADERQWQGSAWQDEYDRQIASLRETVKKRQRQQARYVTQPYAT